VDTQLTALPAPDFDLYHTLNCGQVFHWQPRGAGWVGMMGGRPCYAEQRGAELRVSHGMEAAAHHYFALDHPLPEIISSFPKDPTMAAALAAYGGMRVIRQPAWECVATFITSVQKAVPHITQISHTLRRRYGQPVVWQGDTFYAYPEPASLAALDEAALRTCALGYRAKNLLGAARMIAEGVFDLHAIESLDDEAALGELCRLPGVGVKVANCALLFAYERLGAVPIDVWIGRVLREKYGKRRSSPAKLRDFASRYFGPYAGYAQQYLFHHARSGKRKK
jgi:N-glycosylase/DNA lyase